jgi:hypothetical protein
MESDALQLARGVLWASSTLRHGDFDEWERLKYDLTNKVMTTLWCIYLQPHGENTYWRFAGIHNCGAYLHGIHNKCLAYPHGVGQRFEPPKRYPFWYGWYDIPGEQKELIGWSKETLEQADRLAAELWTRSERIPRLHLAGHLQRAMAATEIMAYSPVRLQLAVTALETFYVSPKERLYIWDKPVVHRIRQVCQGNPEIHDSYFDDLRLARSSAVHRGGQECVDGTLPSFRSVLIRTELILRESLKWGILNQLLIDEYFEQDAWPEDLGS